jgi:hydrogenase nickel incorporation protein HypA/HybF
LAMGIVDAVKNSLKGHKVKAVRVVEIEMGELNNVTHEQMRQVFEMAAKGTIAEGAKLEVKIKEGKVRCLDCGYSGRVEVDVEHGHDHSTHLHCPKCSGGSLEILEGGDIEVRNIRADVEE